MDSVFAAVTEVSGTALSSAAFQRPCYISSWTLSSAASITTALNIFGSWTGAAKWHVSTKSTENGRKDNDGRTYRAWECKTWHCPTEVQEMTMWDKIDCSVSCTIIPCAYCHAPVSAIGPCSISAFLVFHVIVITVIWENSLAKCICTVCT